MEFHPPPSVKFGVLLPVTSRGLPDKHQCIRNLESFSKSLKDTTEGDTCDARYELKVYVGVDDSDTFLSSSNRVEKVLREHGIENAVTMAFSYHPGSLCAIWRDLARRAHGEQCHYTVLLGDDTVLKTPGWMSSFDKAFCELESKRGVPRGFGCIAFSDRCFPGFPTFPVMGRIHLEMFDGEIIPKDFINQDGDPYLFQLYRRWGCSVMLDDVFLENTMGGSREPHYRKKHRHDWTFSALDDGVAKVREWLTQNRSRTSQDGPPPFEILTLDVVVPTFRIPLLGIDNIVKLERSQTCSTMIILIVDDPLSPDIPELKKRYEHDAFIRIRVNVTNAGASEARNRGLADSAADYVLFLDDDVVPDPRILLEAEKVIRQYPKSCGFVGHTKFPDPTSSVVSSAVVLSGVTSFWGVTKHLSEDLPWGVTANLLVRRSNDNISFDPKFPKTGGGEDIDFCLRKREAHVKLVDCGEGFRGAPNMTVIHPWWNHGRRSFNHFRGWGLGDGGLVKMHPTFAYMDRAPNSAETLLLATILCALAAALAILAPWTTDTRVNSTHAFYALLLSIPEVVVANVLYEIHRHLCSTERHHHLPHLRGLRRILAAGESAVVRMFNEWGRLEGMIRRGEWTCIGWRFDWFAGRFGEEPLHTERRHTLGRFQLWLQILLITIVCSSIGSGIKNSSIPW